MSIFYGLMIQILAIIEKIVAEIFQRNSIKPNTNKLKFVKNLKFSTF